MVERIGIRSGSRAVLSAHLLDCGFGRNKGQDWTIANEDDEPGLSAGNFYTSLSCMTLRLSLLALSFVTQQWVFVGRQEAPSLEPDWWLRHSPSDRQGAATQDAPAGSRAHTHTQQAVTVGQRSAASSG